MHRRINAISLICQRCGVRDETVVHMAFKCAQSRATWFASQLNLRTDHLPSDFPGALIHITSELHKDQIASVANLLWCIWKARNELIFSGHSSTPQEIIKRARAMDFQPQTGSSPHLLRRGTRILLPPGAYVVALIDASWDQSKNGGTGMLVYNCQGQLVYTEYKKVVASDPLPAEALALSAALDYMQHNRGTGKGLVFSDCRVLLEAVTQQQIENLPSWDATETVAMCLHKFRSMQREVELRYANREKLGDSHKLANWARTTAQNFIGCMLESFRSELEISMLLNPDHFQNQMLERIR